MRYHIACSMYAGVSGEVDLPEGRTWDDVSTWYVKWDRLYVTFKDGVEYDEPLNSDSMEAIDWKYPSSVTVYATTEDDEIDFDNEVAST